MNKEEKLQEALKMLRESGLSMYRISKETKISPNQLKRWIDGKNEPTNANLETLFNYLFSRKHGTVIPSSEDLAQIATMDLVKKVAISGFEYVPLVPIRARAGYLAGYGDSQFINELPIIPIIHDRTFKGKYMCFEVEGDSMYDGSADSVKDGDILLGREVRKDLWINKLHIKEWYFIIVHKEGIMIKQIVNHDVDHGTITCHSLNPVYGDDFIINLNDTYELYNAVQIVARQMKL